MAKYVPLNFQNGVAPAINDVSLNYIQTGVVGNNDNTLNNTKGIATNSAAIDEIIAHLDIETKLAPTSGKFYDFVGSTGQFSQGSIDFGKTFAAVINTGTNTVAMTSLLSAKDGTVPALLSDCFEVGEEITLQDDSIKETFNITNVDDGLATLTLSANIVGTFATGANIYRSNLKTNGTAYKFGGFNAEEVKDRTTPTQVVNSPYTTIGNGGRKLIRHSNGKDISITMDGNNGFYLYESDDGYDTNKVLLDSVTGFSGNLKDVAIAELANGNIGILYVRPTVLSLRVIQSNGTLVTVTNADTGQTDAGKCSIIVTSTGDIRVAWSTKNASFANSFNIRTALSVDNGLNWSTPVQNTQTNSSGFDRTNPSIAECSDGEIGVLYTYEGSNAGVYFVKSVSGVFQNNVNGVLVYQGLFGAQLNPCIDTLSNGDLIATWQGITSGSSGQFWVLFTRSTDGVTWDSITEVTNTAASSCQQPTITRNTTDEIFIAFFSIAYNVSGSTNNIATTKFNGSWSTPVNITSETTNPAAYPNSINNFRDFTDPLLIFTLNTVDVKFYGKWIEGTETDLLDIDIRMNITPLQDVSDIGAYMNISDNVLAVDGKVSIVDSTATENYTDLVDTRYPIDATNDEVASLLNSTVTAEDKVTLMYNLTRTLTTDDVSLVSILGGVA